MTIETLITGQDNWELIRDEIGAILLVESSAQQTLAQSVAATVTRTDDSDYTATASKAAGAKLQDGYYTATAGTLVAGVGTWTCVAPNGETDQVTTTAADDDLEFGGLGITFAVTAISEPWDTGDSLRVWAPDPELFRLRVYTERSNPWAEFVDAPENTTQDGAPIVNVWFSSWNADHSKSNPVSRQKVDATYNVDVYGYGKAIADGAGGHTPGDAKSAFEAQRAARLVRNILMAGHYTYLGLRGTVWGRNVRSVTQFQPLEGERAVQHVTGVRLVFEVGFSETSPQVQGELLELVSTSVERADDGKLYMTVDTPIT